MSIQTVHFVVCNRCNVKVELPRITAEIPAGWTRFTHDDPDSIETFWYHLCNSCSGDMEEFMTAKQ